MLLDLDVSKHKFYPIRMKSNCLLELAGFYIDLSSLWGQQFKFDHFGSSWTPLDRFYNPQMDLHCGKPLLLPRRTTHDFDRLVFCILSSQMARKNICRSLKHSYQIAELKNECIWRRWGIVHCNLQGLRHWKNDKKWHSPCLTSC